MAWKSLRIDLINISYNCIEESVNRTADTGKYGPRLATDRETSLHQRSIIDYHIRPIDISTGYTVLAFCLI